MESSNVNWVRSPRSNNASLIMPNVSWILFRSSVTPFAAYGMLAEPFLVEKKRKRKRKRVRLRTETNIFIAPARTFAGATYCKWRFSEVRKKREKGFPYFSKEERLLQIRLRELQ